MVEDRGRRAGRTGQSLLAEVVEDRGRRAGRKNGPSQGDRKLHHLQQDQRCLASAVAAEAEALVSGTGCLLGKHRPANSREGSFHDKLANSKAKGSRTP